MKIAIIGSGISGLASAYLLEPYHDITLYEKNDYLGGHSRTVIAKTDDGDVPVDTGFIVFNEKNYPHLTALFKRLGVPVAKSDMSFGVSIDNGWLEYGTRKLSDLFAQKTNLIRPSYLKMLRDIMKFNKEAHHYLEQETELSLGELLDKMKMGRWFRDYYLLAMGGAIWSTPLSKMLDFPALTFLRFFDNHGLLTVNDQPQWHTVIGGSHEYVKRISQKFSENIKLGCGVEKVKRLKKQIQLIDANGKKESYDQVIFACHSDQALKILDAPTKEEKKLLSAIRYQPNEMVLHSDESFMQKRKNAWSSWVYLSDKREGDERAVGLSYWMNNLQPLKTKKPIIVTLNPAREPDENLVHDRYQFMHPVFDGAAIEAQGKIDSIQGTDRIWYCGAWQRYGFHEDGLLSAVNMAKKMGVSIPWT